MKTAAVVRIRVSALCLAMAFASGAWAGEQTEASRVADSSQAQADSGCRVAGSPRVIIFSAVMQPSQPGCAAASQPRIDNTRAPQAVPRPQAGQRLFRPGATARYSF